MTLSVNGVTVEAAADRPAQAAVARELLRQRAVALGLATDTSPAADADAAIERLLEREVGVPTPGEDECLRYYEAHAQEFTSGELAFARHILFQVTPGVPVPALRAKAELTLAELAADPSKFERYAREYSNCPSGQLGGNLGQLGRGETVPEFEQALFNGNYLGLYPQLVKTRYGFHILAVDRRVPGRKAEFQAVRARISARLGEQGLAKALAEYVQRLAAQAQLTGIDFESARRGPVTDDGQRNIDSSHR